MQQVRRLSCSPLPPRHVHGCLRGSPCNSGSRVGSSTGSNGRWQRYTGRRHRHHRQSLHGYRCSCYLSSSVLLMCISCKDHACLSSHEASRMYKLRRRRALAGPSCNHRACSGPHMRHFELHKLLWAAGLCPDMLNANRTLGSKSALCQEPQSLGRVVIGEGPLRTCVGWSLHCALIVVIVVAVKRGKQTLPSARRQAAVPSCARAISSAVWGSPGLIVLGLKLAAMLFAGPCRIVWPRCAPDGGKPQGSHSTGSLHQHYVQQDTARIIHPGVQRVGNPACRFPCAGACSSLVDLLTMRSEVAAGRAARLKAVWAGRSASSAAQLRAAECISIPDTPPQTRHVC